MRLAFFASGSGTNAGAIFDAIERKQLPAEPVLLVSDRPNAGALDRARATQPDLIILDAQMPDMHGFDVCRALRSDSRFGATTPIVITTAGPSGRTQRLEAYRAGAWEFLGQPLDGEAVPELVE